MCNPNLLSSRLSWCRNAHDRAGPRGGFDGEFCSDRLGPFRDAEQAEMLASRECEETFRYLKTATIVSNFKEDAISFESERDP